MRAGRSLSHNGQVLVSEFDFHLPDELIARQPLADRAAARMLHVNRSRDLVQDRGFRDLPGLLRPDDLLVFNNTKDLPARLFGHRSGSRAHRVAEQNPAAKEFLRGKVEVLLTKRRTESPMVWEALVHPGRKLGTGERVYFGGDANEQSHDLAAEIIGRGTFGERHLRFDPVDDFFGTLNRIGHIPLPPYIDRPDTPEDREQYQTVYAKPLGSVAAPTAGLHFTPEILEQIRGRGIETAELTLHVGLGTFQPVRVQVVEEHALHKEWYEIPEEAAEKIQWARDAGRRIVAVGTTTVRTLEYAARRESMLKPNSHERGTGETAMEPGSPGRPLNLPLVGWDNGQESPPKQNRLGRATHQLGRATQVRSDAPIVAQSGEADIFIYPGFEFKVVGAMLTNFHLPKSTLLMLVAAFAGRDSILRAYEHAVEEKYRFYSYGDCMFVE